MKTLKHFIIIIIVLACFSPCLAAQQSEKVSGCDKLKQLDSLLKDQPLPSYFNWMDLGGVTPCEDQGTCPLCWAFAATAAMESKIKIMYGEAYDISEQYIISCRYHSTVCMQGGNAKDLEFFVTNQPILEQYAKYECKDCPHPPPVLKCKQFENLPRLPYIGTHFYYCDEYNMRYIKLSILTDGPVVAYLLLCNFRSWWNNPPGSGAIYCEDCERSNEPHVAIIVGWDDHRKAFLFKNSMGEKKGPNGDGTFWFAYPGTSQGSRRCNKDILIDFSNMSIKRTE